MILRIPAPSGSRINNAPSNYDELERRLGEFNPSDWDNPNPLDLVHYNGEGSNEAPVNNGIENEALRKLGAFGLGIAHFGTRNLLSPVQMALSNIGDIGDSISRETNEKLKRIAAYHNIPEEDINAALGQENLATNAGKWLTEKGYQLDTADEDAYRSLVGDNPTFWDETINSVGTSMGAAASQIAINLLLGGAPLAAGALTGLGEATTEAGMQLSKNYMKDTSRWKDALEAARYNLIINAPTDAAIGALEGLANPLIGTTKGGVLSRTAKSTAVNLLTENAQEIKQGMIENATENTFNSGTVNPLVFAQNLLEESKKFPEYFSQLAPTVTASTLLTQGVLGLAGLGMGGDTNTDVNITPENETPSVNLTDNTQQEDEELTKLKEDYAKTLEALQNSTNGNETQNLLIHLNNLENSITNYGKSPEEIKTEKQQVAAPAPAPAPTPTPTPAPTDNNSQLGFGFTETFNPSEKRQEEKKEPTPIEVKDTPDIQTTPQEENTAKKKTKNRNVSRIKTIAGTEVDIRYRAIEADDLITSHTDAGKPNLNYPQELQPRDRTRAQSGSQIDDLARSLDPEMLGANRLASDGAPVIGSDMIVESGNGRTLAIKRAYGWNSEKAKNYRQWVVDNAEDFGLNPEYVANMKNPILVRERISDVDRVKFTSEANRSSIATKSDAEFAMEDASKIKPELLQGYDTERDFTENTSFIARLIHAIVPDNEKGNLLQRDGSVAKAGNDRVLYALAAKAYNDKTIIERLSEKTDDEIKNISKALINAAPEMAIFESINTKPEFSLKEDIMQANEILANLRKTKQKVSEYLATLDINPNETTQKAKKLLRLFGENMRKPSVIEAALRYYARSAMSDLQTEQSGQATMFDISRTSEQILDEAIRVATENTSNKEFTSEILNKIASPKKQKENQEKAPKKRFNEKDAAQRMEYFLTNVAGFSKEKASTLGKIYGVMLRNFAKYAGTTVENLLEDDNLRFNYAPDLWADEDDHSKGKAKAQIEFSNGDGDSILRLSKDSDVSSVIHEIGHFFLQKFKETARNGKLKGIAKSDWQTLLKNYGLTDEDIENNTENWGNAHEKFATDFERYMMTGEAPSRKMARIFEQVKRWMKAVYNSIKDIKYTDTDGVEHPFKLSSEMKEFFDHLLNDDEDEGERLKRTLESMEDVSHERIIKKQKFNQLGGKKGAERLLKAKVKGYENIMHFLEMAKGVYSSVKMNKDMRRFIWQKTGWQQGVDGEWRFEFKDGILKWHKIYKDTRGDTKTPLTKIGYNSLEEIYDNPELYIAYPELKDFKVLIYNFPQADYDRKSHGACDITNKVIEIELRQSPEEMRETLIHEIQHVIQDVEGFASGGSAKEFEKFKVTLKEQEDLLDYWKRALKDENGTPERKRIAREAVKEYQSNIDILKKRGKTEGVIYKGKYYSGINEAYQALTGEREAFNVMGRLGLNEEEHKKLSPEQTEDYLSGSIGDISREDQIIRHSRKSLYTQPKSKSEKFNQSASKKTIEDMKKQSDEVRQKYEGTDKWLKAPNGKKSNLDEKKWLQVRTPNFKEWFGDWENDPKNASQVVDENGEPLVVYHGTRNADFTVFDTWGDGSTQGTGAYFTDKNDIAFTYSGTPKLIIPDIYEYKEDYEGAYESYEAGDIDIGSTSDRGNFPVYLNIRNPYIYEAEGRSWNSLGDISIYDNDKDDFIYNREDGSYFKTIDDAWDYVENELGDEEHQRYGVNPDYEYGTTDDIVRGVRNGDLADKGECDGVIFKDVEDIGHYGGGYPIEGNDYIVFDSNQIKSATDNIGSFSAKTDDIYFQSLSARTSLKRMILKTKQWADIRSWLRSERVEKTPPKKQLNKDDFSFSNPESEKRWRESEKGVKPTPLAQQIKNSVLRGLRGIKSDYPELAGNKELNFAREALRELDRNISGTVQKTADNLRGNLGQLSDTQLELFKKKRVLDNLVWRKKQVPDADLPFGLTEKTLAEEHKKITKLAEQDSNVMRAVAAEERTNKEISKEFTSLAKELGIDVSGVFKNPHYFPHQVLEYANGGNSKGGKGGKTVKGKGENQLTNEATFDDVINTRLNEILSNPHFKKYKGSDKDINTNYVQIVGETQMTMLKDIETMKTMLKLKERYDKAPQLREKLKEAFMPSQKNGEAHNQREGVSLSDIIPEGYSLFTPAGSRLIQSANTQAENIFAMAVEDASEQLEIPFDEVLNSMGGLNEDDLKQLWVVPTEVKTALKEKARKRDRGFLGELAKKLTTAWKLDVLFNPFHNGIYNIRNFTGDLDAVLAGNPRVLKHFGRSTKELTAYFLKGETTPELEGYMTLSGGLRERKINFSDADIIKIKDVIRKVKTDKISIPKGSWEIIKKCFRAEMGFTEWREHLLRYAAYLEYLNEMENNNGEPTNWGASNKDEVLEIGNLFTELNEANKKAKRGAFSEDELREKILSAKAFKLSNDLLGNYDEISKTGKQLRDFLIPFYSWMEVNLKRYYRIMKNGVKGLNSSPLAKKLVGERTGLPFYAVHATETIAGLFILTMATTLFNRLVSGDADDKLPDEVKKRPHITFGEAGGNVYYFDKIGSVADVAEWLHLDSILIDAQEIVRGQQGWGGIIIQMVEAPVNKIINGLNPILKMPFEIATRRTTYPDAFHSRPIRDRGKHFAQSLGLVYPYKLLVTGEPRSDLEEFTKILTYSIEPTEAAYFEVLNKVRNFQERVLDKKLDGFSLTRRGQILQDIKKALRYNDKPALRRYLKEYYKAEGTKKGIRQSIKTMHPLFGLTKEEQKRFMKWLSPSERKQIRQAEKYFLSIAKKIL